MRRYLFGIFLFYTKKGNILMKNYALVELHCHLDGSLYLPWAYETAKKEKVIDSNWTFEDYYNELDNGTYRIVYALDKQIYSIRKTFCDVEFCAAEFEIL